MVPPHDEEPWPTLGFYVCDFIEAHLCHGPGDLLGQPIKLNEEQRAFFCKFYEVEPAKLEVRRGKVISRSDNPRAGRRRFQRCALSLRKGSAKALALDTPIPTPTGWTTMGEIQPGDWVFAPNGLPCRVIHASEVFVGNQCFSVNFRDGSEIIADAGHRWYTEELRNRDYQGSIKTTAELSTTVSVRADGARNHRIPLTAPLILPPVDLPIDPWIFGMWLGDGRTDGPEFTMDAMDFEHFREGIERAAYYISAPKVDSRNGVFAVRASTSPIRNGGIQTAGMDTLQGRLRRLGVLGNKHVPVAYLRASEEQRLALLQGLMDSDGTIGFDGTGAAFTSTVRPLADAVYELAASLGLKPSLRPAKTSLRIAKKPVKEAWRVYFHASSDIPVFSLPRKRARQIAAPANCTAMSSRRHIVAVEEVESVPTRCIAVDSPSHLFLAGRAMIPTHNTEWAAWIAAVELHAEGPVRCDGFNVQRGVWVPVPRPVSDPYIPMIAYSEEQTEELAYGALRRILAEMPIGNDFDIGLERILRLDGKGKAEAVATSPNARDGARTTFQHCDEGHRLVLDGQKRAWTVMLANLAKRPLADPWALETTTAPEPGAGSVAENTMEYARAVMSGRAQNSRLFFFHRQADDSIDISTRKGLKAAIIEASGPFIAKWTDIDRIASTFEEPDADRPYLERVWLNRLVQSTGHAFNMKQWRSLKREFVAPEGSAITLGFDGSRFDDATAIIGTHIETGHQWPLKIWEKPVHLPGWEVPPDEVDAAVADAFERYHVARMYCDPPKWETWVAKWAGTHGEKRVLEWWTNRRKPMAYAIRSFSGAIATGEVSHDGNTQVDDHMGNSRQQLTGLVDEDGAPLWILRKERPDSPKKIDAAVASVISWEARNDAIKAGEGQAVVEPELYFLGWG